MRLIGLGVILLAAGGGAMATHTLAAGQPVEYMSRNYCGEQGVMDEKIEKSLNTHAKNGWRLRSMAAGGAAYGMGAASENESVKEKEKQWCVYVVMHRPAKGAAKDKG